MREEAHLARIASQLATPGKGILAADESTATLTKRFEAYNIACTPETRCAYRTMLFSDKEAMHSYISGVILFDETIRQAMPDGMLLPVLIQQSGALVGIKVDTGLQPFLDSSPCEKITSGFDQLDAKLAAYKDLGASFTKWRATFNVADSDLCIQANAQALARYAAMVQNRGMVPIVEPEVLMDGAHTIAQCFQTTRRVLQAVVAQLWAYDVYLPGMILKPNMITAGKECLEQKTAQECAHLTRVCLADVLPSSIPGVLFLSGGQSEVEATEKLNIINALAPCAPWVLSFSYGRALQASALRIWAGNPAQAGAAGATFRHRAHMNALASLGKWDKALETFALKEAGPTREECSTL